MNQATDSPAAERHLKRPIILIGCPRSGTTLLGQLFAAHPDVAYWEEPRTVWSTGNQHLPDDLLSDEHLSTEIATEIDQRFADFLKQSGKSRFAEKTPSNMLRLCFIHALYPDCRIIHLYRDPRPVVASALNMLKAPPDSNRIAARAREARLRDWPGLVGLFFRDGIARLFNKGGKSFWGPRPPGWQEWQELPPVTMLSKQWCTLIKAAREELQLLPVESWMELRYEDLLKDHVHIIPKLLDFAELEPSDEVSNLADEIIRTDQADAWRQKLSADQITAIEKETSAMLSELGYCL